MCIRDSNKPYDPMEEKEMTFWAHLEDLLWSLVRVVAVLFVFVVVCFCLMPCLLYTSRCV